MTQFASDMARNVTRIETAQSDGSKSLHRKKIRQIY
jgi:hypothetical protein